MEIPRVGVQVLQLPADGVDDLGVAVADVRHVVDRVQVLVPLLVIEVATRAPHDAQGLIVRQCDLSKEHGVILRSRHGNMHRRMAVRTANKS